MSAIGRACKDTVSLPIASHWGENYFQQVSGKNYTTLAEITERLVCILSVIVA